LNWRDLRLRAVPQPKHSLSTIEGVLGKRA
jgi:hypothetical protein